MLQVNVARLHDDNREALSLAWIAGREGGTAVRREAAKAASLIGHLNLTHPNSIQVVGAYEAGTLAGFVERLFEFAPAAVIIADGVTPPPQLLDAAARTHTPLFTSPLPAARVIDKLARYLAKALAESTERHGVFKAEHVHENAVPLGALGERLGKIACQLVDHARRRQRQVKSGVWVLAAASSSCGGGVTPSAMITAAGANSNSRSTKPASVPAS